MNTTLKRLEIGCEAFVLFFFFLRSTFSLLGNKIGDAGVSDIAEALKVNNTLTEIDFCCE